MVAIFGTTISPYLFFWQASQEVEEIKNVGPRKPLVTAPSQATNALERIKVDTYIGMAFSNLVALAIMFTTAATLHAAGTDRRSNIEPGGRGIKTNCRSFRVRHFHNWRGRYRIVGRTGAGGFSCLCHR